MEHTPAPPMTNEELGKLIGCTHSMASRLRAGKRLPGLETLEHMHENLGIPWEELIQARRKGQVEFGRFFRHALAERAAKHASA